MTTTYPQVRKSETVRNSPIPDQSVRSESPRVLKDSDFRTAGENDSQRLVTNIKELMEWPEPRLKRGGQPGNTNRLGSGEIHAKRKGKYLQPEYWIWASMKNRCTNSKNRTHIERYQKRGITVCDRWMNSFINFYLDMGPRPPGPAYQWTLERIDNDKGYSPENCRWARAVENGFNKSTTRPFSYNGMTASLNQWSIALQCASSTKAILAAILKLEERGEPIPTPAFYRRVQP